MKTEKAKLLLQERFLFWFKGFLKEWNMNMTELKVIQIILHLNLYLYMMKLKKIESKGKTKTASFETRLAASSQ